MSVLLLSFGIFEGVALAAYFWTPMPIEARTPGNALAWVSGSSACFYLLVWPCLAKLTDRSVGNERTLTHECGSVSEHSLILACALAPFIAAAASLSPPGAGPFLRLCTPALIGLVAGACASFSVRVGGNALLRPVIALGAFSLAFGPLGRFLSGASGSLPEESSRTILTEPKWALAAALLPVAAILTKRLRAGVEEELQ